jgi:hypothetical protein
MQAPPARSADVSLLQPDASAGNVMPTQTCTAEVAVGGVAVGGVAATPGSGNTVVVTDSSSDEEFMPLCEVTVHEPQAHSVVEHLSERAADQAARTVARRSRRRQLLRCCTRPVDK